MRAQQLKKARGILHGRTVCLSQCGLKMFILDFEPQAHTPLGLVRGGAQASRASLADGWVWVWSTFQVCVAFTSAHVLPGLPCSHLQPPGQRGLCGELGPLGSPVCASQAVRAVREWGSLGPFLSAHSAPRAVFPPTVLHWYGTFVTINEPVK